MANFVYVDNSNVWIEGMHVSAVQRGMAVDIYEAQEKDICDRDWRADFGRLLQFAGGDETDIGRAVLYGSRPPPNDSLWAAAEAQGFEVVVHDRSVSGREKKIDTNIATDVVADSFELMTPGDDEITLVAGDGDYVPTVERVTGRGISFFVVFWDHAARELQEVCTQFISLNDHLDFLRL